MYKGSDRPISSLMLVSFLFLKHYHPRHVKWYFIVFWFASLITNEHLCLCACPFVYLLWRHSCSNPLAIFNGIICLCISYRNSLYVLDIRPLSDVIFENISFHFVGYLFTFVIMFFDAHLKKFLGNIIYLFSFCCPGFWFHI